MPTSTALKKHPIAAAIQAMCYSMLLNSTVQAAPAGGAVVGGTGTINQSGTNTTINQTTQSMAINWQTYNVNTNEHVQYIQPNASSVSLNRILSNDGSMIAGRIDANGRVILVNPNGIFFTPTASINVGSLVASGLDINPTDFMNGNYIFNEIPGTQGKVINSGIINASLGGNVALLGKQVQNDGLIVANLGTVTMAAGKQAVLTFDNDGLLGVKITKEILQSELGIDPAVLNNGTIQAQGGKVLLTASVSQDIFSQAVNTNGIQQATSVVVNKDGTFTLGNGADVVNTGTIDTSTPSTTTPNQNIGRIVLIGQNVTNSGTIKADAQNGSAGDIELHAKDTTLLTQNSITSARSESNGNGGIVKVLGDKVGFFDQSKVDVSGANGGGQALIGGDLHGANTNIRNASTTIVNPNARLYADALQNGNGGKVIVWSNGNTYYQGNIYARGGAISGDGGFVETSGKNNLLFNGTADRSAVHGTSGVLLLDPRDLNICSSSGGGCGNDNSQLTPTTDLNVFFADGGATTDFSISANRLVNVLSTGSVLLQATRNITVDAVNAASNTNSLTLEAGNDINVNAGINLGSGNLSMTSGVTSCGAAACLPIAKDININGTINTTGTISLNSAHDVVINQAIGNANSLIASPSSIGITAANSIQLHANVTTNNGNFTATSTAGYFDNWFSGQTLNVGSGNVSIKTNGVGTVIKAGSVAAGAFLGNIITTGSLSVTTTAGAITQSIDPSRILDVAGTASFDAGANAIDLQNTANNLQGPINLANTVTTTTTGGGTTTAPNDVTLNNAAATTTTTILGTVNVGGTLTINAANDLAVTNAPVTSTGNMNLAFGTNRSTTSTFCYLSGSACADATTLAGTTLTSTTGSIGIAGQATTTNNYNLAGIGFSAPGSASIDGTIGSNDILIGQNLANTWTITSSNAGTLTNTGSAVNFTNIENLTGGSNTDTFKVNAAPANNTGLIDGGGGSDIVNLSIATQKVKLGTAVTGRGYVNIDHVETLNGAGTGNTLIGENSTTPTTWTVNSPNHGTVAYSANGSSTTTTFNAFSNLIGGTGNDTFNLANTVSGLIDGGGGSDIVNITLPNQTVKLGALGTAAGIIYLDRVGTVNAGAGNNTLVGQDTTPNTWNITANNSGNISYTSSNGAVTTFFTGFGSLNGGSATDTFNVTAPGTLSGIVNGGAGSNQLNVTLSSATPNGQINYQGNGTDTVTIDGIAATGWHGDYNPATPSGYDQIAYADATNTTAFNVNYKNLGTGTVTDNATVATYTVHGTSGNDTITLGTDSTTGLNTFQVSAALNSAAVAYANKQNVVIDGGTGTNSLVQTNGTTLTLPSLTLANLNAITNPGNGDVINTTLGTLSVINSGPVNILETDALILGPMNTANPFTLIAGGIVSSTAPLNATAAFNITSIGNDITLTGNNTLSGPLSLTGNNIALNNSVATTFATLNAAGNLTVNNTAGDITHTGAFTVGNNLNLTTPGNVTLNTDHIASGSINAANINLTTAHGIGNLTTTTGVLNVNNTSTGGVNIVNNGNATVDITNYDSIDFTNNGTLTLKRLYTHGTDYLAGSGPFYTVNVHVNGGSLYSANPLAPTSQPPDITASDLKIIVNNGTIGTPFRAVSIEATNSFTYVNNIGAKGYVFYYPLPPPSITTTADLVSISAANALPDQWLIEIESLGEFDPAIFTEVRNYYYEDVAILMPADQRLDATDETDTEEDRQRKAEGGVGEK